MTREAKIGMLTGLGVIVVVGVLLSKYLGDGAAAGPGGAVAAGPTDRQSNLGVGQDYRQNLMRPTNVPSMGAQSTEVVTPGLMPLMARGRSAEAETPVETGSPVIGAPATAIPTGQTPAQAAEPEMPVISVAESSRPAQTMINTINGINQAVVTNQAPEGVRSEIELRQVAVTETRVTHEVAAGDSLTKIAKKYFGSSKISDVQKIVAANRGVLKDEKTPLIVGKKLAIPVTRQAPATPVIPTPARATTPARASVEIVREIVVPIPGDGRTITAEDLRPVTPAPAATKRETTKSYVVKAGDSLEKIARRLSPNKSAEMVAKIKSLNGIKDANDLKAGTALKLPG